MPELPEVETVARDLQRWVAGAVIDEVEVRWERTIRHPLPVERFAAEVRGARIAKVGRRAKSVLLRLDDGRLLSIALRMTGALLVAPPAAPDDRYARVVFHLADGRQLRFRDVRKFGRIGLWRRVGQAFSRHGPEPLSGSFTAARLRERLRRRSGRLKSLLLDQSFIAGVGNIYADEALWHARLHPLRRAGTLTLAEVARLHRALRRVLRQGITNRGTTFSDYVSADGEPGANAEQLSVYRRTGQPCLRCRRQIQRMVVGQRATHWCAHCQPLAGAAA